MKKLYIFAVMMAGSLSAAAQDAYDAANFTQQDLNGTARYVGMGGAMDALGADLSTINSNPAGMGLFRRSMVTGSFGFVSQAGASKIGDQGKTNMSFDQLGFVWVTRNDVQSFINVGFNFTKSRNFNQILQASGLYGLKTDAAGNPLPGSQNGQTNAKWIYNDMYQTNINSIVDDIYEKLLVTNEDDGQGGKVDVFNPISASDYDFGRGTSGYIGNYSFNLSANLRDRVYLGITFGLKDVHYNSTTFYSETANPGQLIDGMTITGFDMTDERRITGTGFDVAIGAIFRPIAESPFRIGVSVKTPTWYTLTSSTYTKGVTDGADWTIPNSYKFKFNTPWKFGLSLGHTINNRFALGAGVEFESYSSSDMRVITGEAYDPYYDSYSTVSASDAVMNQSIKDNLKGVVTLKLGAEMNVTNDLALRIGYNYVSPQFEDNAFRDQSLRSPGVWNASTTDYTNWKGTHRFTAGAGYKFSHFRVDLAYQYNHTNGTFFPCMDNIYVGDIANPTFENNCSGTDVSNKRHQLLLSLSYRF